MSSLFSLLSFLCLICLVIGMFRPKAVIKWGMEEQKTKKSVLKYYGIGLILFFILFAITIDDTSLEKTDPNKGASSIEQTANIDEKIAANLDEKIDGLGKPESMTLEKAVDVMKVRILYNALTSEQQNLVTNISALDQAEEKINVLEEEAAKQAVAQEQIQAQANVSVKAQTTSGSQEITQQENTNEIQNQENEYTVYITNTGEKYHREGCQYLRQSQIAISKSDAINQGYTPCSKCNP